MKHRLLALTALMLIATVPAEPQTNKPAPKVYKAPRTPDGQPDLQGFWTNNTYVPLERPKGVTKEFYTEAEAREMERRAAQAESEQTAPGTIADVHYDFTQFGLDRSQGGFALNLRTSLIVDPPDGKIPPMTAEGRKRTAERAETRKRMGAATDAVQNQPLSFIWGPVGLDARVLGCGDPARPESVYFSKPGNADAWVVSMPRIRACAIGARKIAM